jgi:phosphoribosylanthranilate isomerase
MVVTEPVRVKLCGLTRAEDVRGAVDAGADFLGFVLALDSPRCLSPAALAALLHGVDTGRAQRVAVVRDQPAEWINDVVAACGIDFVQLHGHEPRDFAAALAVPVIRMRPVRAATPTVGAALGHVGPDGSTVGHDATDEGARAATLPALPLAPNVFAVLFDTAGADGQSGGGQGRRADPAAIRAALASLPPGTRAFLAGGLAPDNVAAAVRKYRPWGVDVSSGIETAPGVKDVERMRAFVAAAKAAL